MARLSVVIALIACCALRSNACALEIRQGVGFSTFPDSVWLLNRFPVDSDGWTSNVPITWESLDSYDLFGKTSGALKAQTAGDQIVFYPPPSLFDTYKPIPVLSNAKYNLNFPYWVFFRVSDLRGPVTLSVGGFQPYWGPPSGGNFQSGNNAVVGVPYQASLVGSSSPIVFTGAGTVELTAVAIAATSQLPEPSTLALAGIGTLLLLVLAVRRRVA